MQILANKQLKIQANCDVTELHTSNSNYKINMDKLDIEREKDSTKSKFANIVTTFGECGFKCIKFTFFCFNLIFCLAGIVILAIGIWLHSQKDEAAKDYAHLSGNINYVNGPTFCIAVGVITILVSFLACCGAKTESMCMLGCYSGLLVVILVIEIVSITITYVYRERIELSLKKDFQKTLNKYGSSDWEKLTKSIDELQKDFHCCGNNRFSDWFETPWSRNNTNSVPKSCCKKPNEKGCNSGLSKDSNKIYRCGCYNHVKKYLLENLHIISGFGIWIAMIELLGIGFSTCLICRLKSNGNDFA